MPRALVTRKLLTDGDGSIAADERGLDGAFNQGRTSHSSGCAEIPRAGSGSALMADIKVPVDEPMFDDNPDENSPADGRAGKSVPAAAHTTIDKRAGNLELDSLDSRAHADVPKFVTVLPRVEIVIDARAAALAENSCFLCRDTITETISSRSKKDRANCWLFEISRSNRFGRSRRWRFGRIGAARKTSSGGKSLMPLSRSPTELVNINKNTDVAPRGATSTSRQPLASSAHRSRRLGLTPLWSAFRRDILIDILKHQEIGRCQSPLQARLFSMRGCAIPYQRRRRC